MSKGPPESQLRRLRELAGLAHERELGRELDRLHAELTQWKAGAVSAFAMSDAIHVFHQGAARRLYDWYAGDLEFAVASAIHRGILGVEEAGPETIALVEPHFQFLRRHDEHTDRPTPVDGIPAVR